MKLLQRFTLGLLIIISLDVTAQTSANAKMKTFIDALMKKMTLEEKIGQLNLPSVGFDVTGPLLSKDVDAKVRKGLVGVPHQLRSYRPAVVVHAQRTPVRRGAIWMGHRRARHAGPAQCDPSG